MYIKFLNINKDKSKRLWFIMLTALTIASLLVFMTVYLLLSKENINLGEFNSLTSNEDEIFNIKSYSYLGNVTIVGNKTTNKYHIEEKYEKNDLGDESFNIKTYNDLNNEITYEIRNNSLKVKSNAQINEFNLNNYVIKKTNLISIATFISLYNDVEELIKNEILDNKVKIEVEELSDKILYKVIFNEYNIEKLNEYSDILNDSIGITKLELIISKKEKIPIEYIVYNKGNQAYIDVNYESFSF